MARLVKTIEGQLVRCNVVTHFEDGTESVKVLSVGDVVEGLRYIEKGEVKAATGRISAINTKCTSVTYVDMNHPEDYFAKDVKASTIEIDASAQYEAKLVSVEAMEIVEDAGVENVDKVTVSTVPEVTLEMSYTDGRTVFQDVIVGDILTDMVIMTSPGQPDIKGDFKVVAFMYSIYRKAVNINGIYLQSLLDGKCIRSTFENIVRFTEKPAAHVTLNDSFAELSEALEESSEVYAFMETDVTIPPREDGRITTLSIPAGKKLVLDLQGHNIETLAYAFYVAGGDLILRDTSGTGRIIGSIPNKAYPMVQVNAGGVFTMEGGTIDTTEVPLAEGDANWLYGVVCSGNGIFNMTGGQLITQDAAGISITNGTASGAGAKFNIKGDAVITSKDCTAIYLADNKEVNISGHAVINGGILLRLGDLNISENATVNGAPAGTDVYPLGRLACESGCENHNAVILAMTGCYGSELGNDLNINISQFAKVAGYIDNAIDIATLNTRYDQKVNVTVNSLYVSYTNKLWNIYNHAQLASMAAAEGKTLPAEQSTTDLTIKVNGSKVYP